MDHLLDIRCFCLSEDVSGVVVCCERCRNGSLGVAIDGW